MTRFDFDDSYLSSVAGGRSAIDISRLNIHSLAEAESFIKSYGFNIGDNNDLERLWDYYRRAFVLLTEKLKVELSDIPEIFHERKKLGDIRYLLIYASSRDPKDMQLQKWSCALLRCMHVYVHSEADLFSFFAEDIQKQILSAFESVVINDGAQHKTFLKSFHKEGHPAIELNKFEMKAFKTSSSTVIKLLAKPDALAMRIFDKIGVRFVTHSIFDSFQVIRFLVEENIISFAHIMPDQSSNNIFPIHLFLQVCREFEERRQSDPNFKPSDEAVEQRLKEVLLSTSGEDLKLFRKENLYSSDNYRFIKFITRKLITIQPEGKEKFSFFYPFEVQIVEKETYELAKSGPAEHIAYKERQREAAKARLFPLSDETSSKGFSS